MASIVNAIRECLDTKLSSLSGLPDVAYPNVPYTIISGTPFFKIDFIPTSITPASRGIDPYLRYQGIYSILVCTPENQGPGAGLVYADALLDHFKATSYVSNGTKNVTIDYSEVRTSFLDSPFYCTPVNVVWYTYDR